MIMKKAIRKIKISKAYQQTSRESVSIPYIRIKGKWLKDFGFTQGQNICIQAADKKLVITVEEAI